MDPRSQILDHPYEPAAVESPWAERYVTERAFASDPNGPGAPYCVVLPPPNVTGALHMGHALNGTLQDILVRYRRMRGDHVLWQPGTDHAGIATQTVVERQLRAEGVERRELGREKFVERVWQWKEQYGEMIVRQFKRLGASCDWDRHRFTMDAHSSRAVREAFVRLYDEGLITRGTYLVNWCPSCQTALSDLEVEMEEIDGALYEIRYPSSDGATAVTVATTRPETMLGDTGVAVHPEDERYAGLRGARVRLPLVGREIPVVADAHVDREFGTGVLKITPAHDFNDFEIGARHGLERISILDEHARVVPGYGRYSGLDRFSARKAVVADLESAGLLVSIKPIRHAVGHCYRCRAIVEPHLSQQWFLRAKPLAMRVLEHVDRGETRFLPDRWEKVFRHWLENIRDWCISRQLWWGHRIPVWTCEHCGHEAAYRDDPAACPICASTRLVQQTDVLDTWFSSGLWPMSTLGWPDDTPEFRAWYPTDVLVTGSDILFFWVARMLMFGVHFTGKVPFRDVVLHSIVRDEHGEKMSKTRGNVVDPMDLIQKYGADATRFTLASMSALGRDIRLDVKRIEGYRHFANKLWNAGRFVLRTVDAPPSELRGAPTHPLNRWIIADIGATARRIAAAIEGYAFADVAHEIYALAWDRFCDWYLEGAKIVLREFPEFADETRNVLVTAFADVLRLAHPVMPFVTEALYAALPLRGERPKFLALDRFPDDRPDDGVAVGAFVEIADAVRAVRNIRSENNLPPTQPLDVELALAGPSALGDSAWQGLFTHWARVANLRHVDPAQAPAFSGTFATAAYQIWIPLAGLVDLDAEIDRLRKLAAGLESERERAERKLNNPSFRDRAPVEVVEGERRKIAESTAALHKTRAHIDRLERARAVRG